MIKKLFIVLLLIFALIAGLLFASITLMDHNKAYKEFARALKIDVSSIKTNDITIQKFPSPHLSINRIEQDGKMVVKNVDIYFSFMSLLTLDPQITSIKIGEVDFYLDNKDISLLNHDKFFMDLLSKGVFSIEADIDRLNFITSNNEKSLVIENFRSSVEAGGKLSFSGGVNGVGQTTGTITTSGEEIVFKFVARDTDTDTNFILEENYRNNILENGKFFIESSNLAYKISQCIPDFAEISKRLSRTEKIQVTFDIVPTNTYIGLKNIIINSDSIAGEGEMDLSKDDVTTSDIKLNFTKINLNSLQSSNDENSPDYTNQYSVNKHFDFKKNPTNINIFIQSIKLGESNSIADLRIVGAIANGKLNIKNFAGDIDGGGEFKISGVVTQNSFRSLFEGRVAFSHKDLNDLAECFGGKNARTEAAIPFSFSSDVKMSSVDASLQNLLIKTADTDLMGSISTKYIGDSPRTNATIRFSSVDIDQKNFPAISQVFNYATSLFDGMKNEDYLNRFIPIRKINTIGNYDITFDHLTVKEKTYKNLNFDLTLAPGKIAFERLFIQNDDNWIDTSVILEAQGIKPVIHFIIHDASISANFLSAPGMLELRKEIIDKFDPSKLDMVMKFSIKKLYDGDFTFGRVLFQAKNDKNLLDIKQFDADLFGGRMQSSGSILLQPYTLNFVYAINSAQVSEIAKLLPDGVLDSAGVLSASGMWSTRGDALDAQLYNLYTRSNVLAKGLTVNHFSIDNFIQEIGSENYNISKLQDSIKRALLTNKTEVSDLKTSIELTKGVFTLSDMAFKTKYSAGVGEVLLNLYDFSVDASTLFSFYLAKPQHGRSYTDYAPAKMGVSIKGNIFSPKKTADTKDLEEILKARNQQAPIYNNQ